MKLAVNSEKIINEMYDVVVLIVIYNAKKMTKSVFQKILRQLVDCFGKDIVKSSENHYRIEVMTKNNRTQVVELIYKPRITNNQDVSRFVAISPIGPIFRSFNYEEILKHNSKVSVGAICIDDFQNSEGINIPYLAVRATHLVINAQIEEIIELVIEVAKLADELETEIYGRDIF